MIRKRTSWTSVILSEKGAGTLKARQKVDSVLRHSTPTPADTGMTEQRCLRGQKKDYQERGQRVSDAVEGGSRRKVENALTAARNVGTE